MNTGSAKINGQALRVQPMKWSMIKTNEIHRNKFTWIKERTVEKHIIALACHRKPIDIDVFMLSLCFSY